MKGQQSWVTYAGSDDEGLKALILATSLRRTITTQLLTIFVGDSVSDEIRQLLENEFDRCITLRWKSRCQNVDFKSLSLIHSWKLTKLKKFVFVDCNCLVLRNSDELFRTFGLALLKQGNSNHEIPISVLVDTPSSPKFDKLLNCISTSIEINTLLEEIKALIQMDELATLELNDKFNVEVNLDGCSLKQNMSDIYLTNFTGTYPLELVQSGKISLEKMGILEEVVFTTWAEVFCLLKQRKEIGDIIKVKLTSPTIPTPLINLDHLHDLKNSIAIIGQSLRFPGANSLPEFWNLLLNSQDGITKVPPNRWTPSHSSSGQSPPSKISETQAGFLSCPVDEIDLKFFSLSPAEVSYLDPQQRLTLQVMWEALEHSGIDPLSLKNSNTGVFGGWWRTDYKEMIQTNLREEEFFRTYMGNSLGTLTGRISHILDLKGPSISTESGCSTSIVVVDMACKSLLQEDCDLGLAFGVNLLLHPFSTDTLNFVVAPDGHCKTFDESADGFGRAEGCAVLVLKRFSDAVRDGDNIQAVIRGSAVVQEGPSKSMGTPTKGCEALAMKLALEDAGIEGKDVSFVETHGTGTPVGDPLEVAAINEVYSKGRVDVLTLGSVKTNIGHTESCSGIAGIIKTILALQNEIIPPHRNFTKLNPEIGPLFEKIPARIPLEPLKWPRDKNVPRIAGVSSFGITGTDAHVIIQESPRLNLLPSMKSTFDRIDTKIPTILKLSAKSRESLQSLISAYKQFLPQSSDTLVDICYTANTGRANFPHRTAVCGRDKLEILSNLQRANSNSNDQDPQKPKICFLFTGQGSQFPQMAKQLYDHSPIFKMHFDSCSNILKNRYEILIKESIWDTEFQSLSRTLYSQTSIFCVEYALLKLWESWGITPDLVLGHSLGEFCASVAAGILTLEDALTLVAQRSILIDTLPPGKMLVVRESSRKVEMLLKQFQTGQTNGHKRWLDFAALNSPEQTVLAGTPENIRDFASFCENNNIKTHILEATHPFHSRLMDPILDSYREVTQSIKYSRPKCVYISGMEGRQVDTEIDASYWVKHTSDPVRFLDASQALFALEGNIIFLEVGPQPILTSLISINSETATLSSPITCLLSIRKNEPELTTMYTTLAKLYTLGLDINWQNLHQNQYHTESLRKVTVPFYQFQNKPYWFNTSNQNHSLHPLLGTPLSNPSQIKIFQNSLDPTNNKQEYLLDHVIGKSVVFPGAGFLEMCLTAGYVDVDIDGDPLTTNQLGFTLEDFAILQPLALPDGSRVPVQTHVVPSDHSDSVSVNSKLSLDKLTHKWIRHATANFVPYLMHFGTEEEDFFKKDTLQDVKSRCRNPVERNYYKKFADVGLNFGERFCTLGDSWRDDETVEIYFEVDLGNSSSDEYIYHPLIIDAMFQAFILGSNPSTDKLHVPVSVQKFVCYAKLQESKGYIQVRPNSKMEYTTVLYDLEGHKKCVMVGASFIETNVFSVLQAIEYQRSVLPSMYEDIWRKQRGHNSRRIKVEDVEKNLSMLYQPEFKTKVGMYDKVLDGKFDQLCSLYMLKAFCDLGLDAKLKNNKVYSLNKLVKELKIKKTLERLFRYMILELVEEGLLKLVHLSIFDTQFSLLNKLQPLDRIECQIRQISDELQLHPQNQLDLLSLQSTGEHLASIFQGKINPLQILFPEDKEVKVAEEFYTKSQVTIQDVEIFQEIFVQIIPSDSDSVLRVLEVGAGTGSLTKTFLPFLSNSECEYTYTDVSASFFPMGERIFENYSNKNLKVYYKLLDIESNPIDQGFMPQNYDVILAKYVIHAAEDVEVATRNLRNLLRPGGLLIFSELTKPLRLVNMVFGVLDGFWKFKDTHLRKYHCEINEDEWKLLLEQNGFSDVVSYPCCGGHNAVVVARRDLSEELLPNYLHLQGDSRKIWIVFSNGDEESLYVCEKLSQIDKRVVAISKIQGNSANYENFETKVIKDDSEITQFFDGNLTTDLEGVIYLWTLSEDPTISVCKPYLTLCKILSDLDQVKLYLFSRGLHQIGDHVLHSPTPSILWGMTKVLGNENQSLTTRCIDLDIQKPPLESIQEGFAELYINDQELQVCYRNNQRFVQRLANLKLRNSSLPFPKSQRYSLLLSSREISELKFAPCDDTFGQDQSRIEVKVLAYSLNFRDIFAIIKPSSYFDNINTVGLDYSGVVVRAPKNAKRRVGDLVFGINLKGSALPSHIETDEDLVCLIPPEMTTLEACTLPAVTATVYICLVEVAKLKRNETILIHTASGGVGLCAIQLAQELNCIIVATAGSCRKREYLRGVGIKHVFNSRTVEYRRQIEELGIEVDVVLNSLTSPGFKEASLKVLKSGGRFVEMSKLNIWTVEDVRELRPDVFYKIVDLTSLPESKIKELMQIVPGFVKKPIPYTRFDAGEIREALGYLQKAKHIGKIVCTMPNQSNGLFNDRSSYLITGGLGGIGFEVCKWMVESGARNLVLVGRSAPGDEIREEITKLESKYEDLKITTRQVDIGSFEQCKDLIESITHPLRGIMHCAGVLMDASYSNQSWEKYSSVLSAKVSASINLHNLTKSCPLEFFVMFSSATVNFGSPGQSNHVGANSFLDSLAHYRQSVGLPGISINWGQWGQVGVAKNLDGGLLFKPISPYQGICGLDLLMRRQRVQSAVCEVSLGVLGKALPQLGRYFEELTDFKEELHNELEKVSGETFFEEYDQAKSADEKYGVVAKCIQTLVQLVLKTTDPISDNTNLQEMGMDSLMMIELKNLLQSVLGERVKLTANSVKNCNTVSKLGHKIVEIVEGNSEAIEEEPPTREELKMLIKQDSELPPGILYTKGNVPRKVSEIETVLITGVTGNLGPYILRELSRRPHIKKIYCLMRPNTNCKERLLKILKDKNLSEEINLQTLEVVEGSVSVENLGLSPSLYSTLASEVDSVFHLAVVADLLSYYNKSAENPSRSVNVLGTRHILQFCCESAPKSLYYSSTVVAVSTLSKENRLSEDWPNIGDFDQIPNSAYPVSKFICDLLMAQAVRQGIETRVFRFPFIGGDSKTGGNISVMNNHLLLRMMTYMQMKCMPAITVPFLIVPVDLSAEISCEIFFNEECPADVYNVTNPYANEELEIVDLARDEFGLEIEVVEPEMFFDRMRKVEDSELVHFMKKSGEKKEGWDFFMRELPEVALAWLRDRKGDVFLSEKLERVVKGYPWCMEGSLEVLKRDLVYARDKGVGFFGSS